MDVSVNPHGTKNRWVLFGLCLDGYLIRLHGIQRFLQEAHIEGNFVPLAIHHAVDTATVVADFGSIGTDVNLPRGGVAA